RDDAQAFRWYLLAAEQGNVEAQFHVGRFLEYGRAGGRDLQQAMHWYGLSAAQGHRQAEAQRNALQLARSTGASREDAQIINDYSGLIMRKVRAHWRPGLKTPSAHAVEVRITLLPGGEVASAVVT
ncbi:tetratricopeptide repeat protein, partial [Acinetobacter baumannii]